MVRYLRFVGCSRASAFRMSGPVQEPIVGHICLIGYGVLVGCRGPTAPRPDLSVADPLPANDRQ